MIDSIEHIKKLKSLIDASSENKEQSIMVDGVEENPIAESELNEFKLFRDLLLENELLKLKSELSKVHEVNERIDKIRKFGITAGIATVAILGLWFVNQITTESQQMVERTSFVQENTQIAEEVPNNQPEEDKLRLPEPFNADSPYNTEVKPNQVNIYSFDSSSGINEATAFIVNSTVENTLPQKVNHTEPLKESNAIVDKKKCELEPLSASIVTNPSCEAENTGSIIVKSITGGAKPYQITIYDVNHHKVDDLSALPIGNYTLYINDAEKCQKQMSFTINGKSCPLHYVISPSQHTSVHFPKKEKVGKLIVYNSRNSSYFQYVIHSGEELVWEGRGSDGTIDEGVYMFVIEYGDELQKGTITIKD